MLYWLSVCLLVCLSVCQCLKFHEDRSLALSICRSSTSLSFSLFSLSQSISLSICLSVYLSDCQSVSQSVSLSVCLSVCLSIFLYVYLYGCLSLSHILSSPSFIALSFTLRLPPTHCIALCHPLRLRPCSFLPRRLSAPHLSFACTIIPALNQEMQLCLQQTPNGFPYHFRHYTLFDRI